MMNILELESKPLAELRAMATKDFNIPNANRLKKEALVLRLRQEEAAKQGLEVRGGILEILDEGLGFLRSARYTVSEDDLYDSPAHLRRYRLRNCDPLHGQRPGPRQA